MRRIIRRTVTIVTVQTWTLTWAEEVPDPKPARASAAAPALPPGPARAADDAAADWSHSLVGDAHSHPEASERH